jgi:hypothetical protein
MFAIVFIHDFCDHVTTRLRTHRVNYVRDLRGFLLALLLAALADGLSTVWFMRVDGVEAELHPVVRGAAAVLGPWLGAALGKAVQVVAIVLVTLYWRHLAKLLLGTASLVYLWAAWYNLWGYELYTPLLVRWLWFL